MTREVTEQELKDDEIFVLAIDCGLDPQVKYVWSHGRYVEDEQFIKGDIAALLQFANLLKKKERNKWAALSDHYGSIGALKEAMLKDES